MATNKNKLVADKSLGQHFLNAGPAPETIANDWKDAAFEAIIEVGPGPGALTGYLKARAGTGAGALPFYVLEKDQRMQPSLQKILTTDQIIIGDALDGDDFDRMLERPDLAGKSIWLISNLPYNISVPLYLKFLRCPQIKFMTLMFQKEVALKILGKDTNSLAVLSAVYGELHTLLHLKPQHFSPPPEVESTVISFQRKNPPLLPLATFEALESFLRRLFMFKRKQLQQVLKRNFSQHLPIIKEHLPELAPLELTIRAEKLSLEQVLKLFELTYGQHSPPSVTIKTN